MCKDTQTRCQKSPDCALAKTSTFEILSVLHAWTYQQVYCEIEPELLLPHTHLDTLDSLESRLVGTFSLPLRPRPVSCRVHVLLARRAASRSPAGGARARHHQIARLRCAMVGCSHRAVLTNSAWSHRDTAERVSSVARPSRLGSPQNRHGRSADYQSGFASLRSYNPGVGATRSDADGHAASSRRAAGRKKSAMSLTGRRNRGRSGHAG